jgi:Phospholipase_D-nuclease N-terminal/Short C-terminal domain
VDFWDFFWLLVWSFFFVMYLMVLFQIIRDLFRDSDLSGWSKALWIIALIFAPFLSAIIYLIARGRAMAERQARDMADDRAATDEYIQSVSGRSVPAEQIASAKQLLDSGTITQAEFDRLKEKALA